MRLARSSGELQNPDPSRDGLTVGAGVVGGGGGVGDVVATLPAVLSFVGHSTPAIETFSV